MSRLPLHLRVYRNQNHNECRACGLNWHAGMLEECPRCERDAARQIAVRAHLSANKYREIASLEHQKTHDYLDIVEAAREWDRAHPHSSGICDNDDERICVTGRALKEALT